MRVPRWFAPHTGRHLLGRAVPVVAVTEPEQDIPPVVATPPGGGHVIMPVPEWAIPTIPLSSVRDAVLVTGHPTGALPPLPCFSPGCGHAWSDLNADQHPDLYWSAAAAGHWVQDPFGTWRCPRCARRHAAVFGVRPVAEISAPVPGLPAQRPRRRAP